MNIVKANAFSQCVSSVTAELKLELLRERELREALEKQLIAEQKRLCKYYIFILFVSYGFIICWMVYEY